MATDPNLSKNFDNKYDNADLQMDRRAKDIAAAYTEYDEMKAYKLYLETLETESRVSEGAKVGAVTLAKGQVFTTEIKKDGSTEVKAQPISSLLPKRSEFEQARRSVIVKLNGATDTELKQLFAEFETESIFELSSKITNFLLDKRRRDRVAGTFTTA